MKKKAKRIRVRKRVVRDKVVSTGRAWYYANNKLFEVESAIFVTPVPKNTWGAPEKPYYLITTHRGHVKKLYEPHVFRTLAAAHMAIGVWTVFWYLEDGTIKQGFQSNDPSIHRKMDASTGDVVWGNCPKFDTYAAARKGLIASITTQQTAIRKRLAQTTKKLAEARKLPRKPVSVINPPKNSPPKVVKAVAAVAEK